MKIQNIVEEPTEKYCMAFHHNGTIHLLHSVFMAGNSIFGCTSRGNVDDRFAKFVLSHFINHIYGRIS